MGRNANAAAHHQPIHQGDERLGAAGNPGIQQILIAPKGKRRAGVAVACIVKPADITSGAKAPVALARQKDCGHALIRLKAVQRGRQVMHHPVRQRIDRGWSVQPQPGQRTRLFDDHFSHGQTPPAPTGR